MTDQEQPKMPAPPKKPFANNEQKIIDDILKNMPSNDAVECSLPSKNRFYTLQDPGKPITLRPMTFEDERGMMSKKNVNVDILNGLLSKCLSNIDVGQLLQMDKLYLIMKLREISYGAEYNAGINCPSCKKDNEVQFDLSQLPVVELGDDFSNPMIVELPILKKTIKISIPRVADERYFANAENAINNLWRFVEEIDGHDQKSVISKVIPQLPLKDAHTLLDAMGASEYGIDTKVRFVCNYCSFNEVMELPISADFFTGK
tara:strand:+ start:611 stop:1390 length:780 start_codon:yes stop_codon:yes gene_type:complete